MISIILPTYNEIETGYLARILDSFRKQEQCEIIIVDGGSTDGTLELLRSESFQLYEKPNSSRAARLQHGINVSSGSIILLHHPRSILPDDAVIQLQEIGSKCKNFWGGFTHAFDSNHPLLTFTSWYSNRIRCDRKNIVYLDHCLFCHRSLLDAGVTIPDVNIFEDSELSYRLSRHSKAIRLPAIAMTSALRFRRNGFFRQATMNQILKLGYFLGIEPKRMNQWYEKGLDLNQKH